MEIDLKLIEARLSHFEAASGTVARRPYVGADVAPTHSFLRYTRTFGLCLDWLVSRNVENPKSA